VLLEKKTASSPKEGKREKFKNWNQFSLSVSCAVAKIKEEKVT
jgi:hypothetical protein